MSRRLKRIPSFSYPGGKVRLRNWLLSFFPQEGGTYVEPFAGRAAVFFAARCYLKFKSWWLNDPTTCVWMEALRKVDPSRLPDIENLQSSDEQSWRTRARMKDPVALALEPYLLYGGLRWNMGELDDGHTKATFIPRSPSPRRRQNVVTNVRDAGAMLRGVQITGDWWADLDLSSLGTGDFAYVDPPYVDIKNVGAYGAGTVNHAELLDRLEAASFSWVLSDYPNDLYLDRLGPPHAKCEATLGMGSGQSPRDHREECVWLSR